MDLPSKIVQYRDLPCIIIGCITENLRHFRSFAQSYRPVSAFQPEGYCGLDLQRGVAQSGPPIMKGTSWERLTQELEHFNQKNTSHSPPLNGKRNMFKKKHYAFSKLPNLPKHCKPQAFAKICRRILQFLNGTPEVTLIKPISILLNSFESSISIFQLQLLWAHLMLATWQLDEMHRQFAPGR